MRVADDSCRVMAAHVEERPQHAFVSSDDDDRFAARELAGNVAVWCTHLVGAARHLP